MSTTYTDLIYTSYPDSTDEFETKTDIPAESATIALVNQYKALFNRGQVSEARALLTANPTLKSMIISAADFNKLQDAILAMQRFYSRDQQQILFSATEPTGEYQQTVGDVWMKTVSGGYEMYLLTDTGYVRAPLASVASAASATKLATARKIGNASFNGTANITLAQIGAMPAANFSFDSSTGTLNITL